MRGKYGMEYYLGLLVVVDNWYIVYLRYRFLHMDLHGYRMLGFQELVLTGVSMSVLFFLVLDRTGGDCGDQDGEDDLKHWIRK